MELYVKNDESAAAAEGKQKRTPAPASSSGVDGREQEEVEEKKKGEARMGGEWSNLKFKRFLSANSSSRALFSQYCDREREKFRANRASRYLFSARVDRAQKVRERVLNIEARGVNG